MRSTVLVSAVSLATATLLATSAAGAQPNAGQPNAARDRWADSARREADAAYLRNDRPRLAAARVLLERALAAFPGDPLLLHYQGYALWREAALSLARDDRSGARALLEQADAALERSASRLRLAETYALHSSVVGQLIGTSGNPLDGMRLGPKSSELMDRAEAEGPRNPRVALLRGMSAVYTPSMFGGGLDRARTHLQRAITLFAADRPTPGMPAWGHADAYAYLGQVHAKAGRRDEARAAYRQALALQPDYGWVREVLLPALDRAGR